MNVRVEITVGKPRLLVAMGVLAIALLLPAVALASHVFTDVPNGHTFHTNIANLAGAGVTAGCTPTTYCPDQAVTRAQMAGFLNRGLGRVAEADITGSNPPGVLIEWPLGSVTITPGTSPGALPGASQFVRAELTGTAYFNDTNGCPCTLHLILRVGDNRINGYDVELTTAVMNSRHPVSVGGVIEVQGNGPVTVSLKGFVEGGDSDTTRYTITGSLVAETFPFGYQGGQDLGPTD